MDGLGRDGMTRSRLVTASSFGYVPTGLAHAYQVKEPTRPRRPGQPPFVSDFSPMQAARRTTWSSCRT